MKRRLTAILTALAMSCLSGFSADMIPPTAIQSSAAEVTSGECGAEGSDLNWTLDNGTLTITGIGAMADYTNYSGSACPWTRSEVTSIVIGSGVTTIGNYAFYYCRNLKTVAISGTVQSIGDHAFSETGLTSIVIPSGVRKIGSYAFYQSASLSEISIPETVERIGGRAFYSTPWMEAQRESGDTLIVNNVLVDATSASGSCTVPDGIKSISGYAFYYSTVTDITIPAGVEHIAENAFSYARTLSKVSVPDTVTEIEDSAFSDCEKLTEIAVSSGNKAYSSASGVLYNKSGTELLRFPQAVSGAFEIPSAVRTIVSGAFFGARSLTEVTIPAGTETIGDSAFSNCIRLKSITVPDSVTFLGNGVFKGCRALREATVGSGVTAIPDETFSSCRGLTKVSLGSGITTIGSSAFSWCDRLEEIKLPDNITYIGSEAFWCCTSLKTAVMPAKLETIDQRAFYQCRRLSGIELPTGLKTIDSEAFYECTSLKTLTIPETVTAINGGACMTFNLTDGSSHMSYQGAFTGCMGLESVTLNCPLTRINKSVFYNCSALKSISIPDTVTDIDEYAFANCTSLTDVHFSEKLIRINKGAFEGCSVLTELDLPASLKTVGESAFRSCTGLKELNVPEKVWKLDKSSFSGCIGLATADIPASVTTLGAGAFETYTAQPTYTYELFAMNEVSATLYDGTTTSIYIKTDNPDPAGFSILTTAPISNKDMRLKDVAYKDPADTNVYKAVDGGYIWTFSAENAGTFSLLVTENSPTGAKIIGAAVELTVRDSSTESDKWIDEVIAAQTTDKMDNFEKMSAVSSYLMKNFKYYPNDGKYLLSLGSVADAPYFAAHRWDSYVSPSVLCEFAKRIGGFDEIVDLYSSYADYGYTWNTGHYLCYCASGDRHEVYNACPTSSTGVIEYEMIDFTDTSKLWRLTDAADIDISGYTPLTITGVSGSAAEKFASENGIRFSTAMTGDVNGDGALTAADLVTMEKYLTGSGTLAAPKNADLLKDGRIDTYDLILLRKSVIGTE